VRGGAGGGVRVKRGFADFSVVLFRPHFMLVSEEFPMKSHKNQWVWSMPCPPEHLAGAISRVQILVSGVQTPSQCPDTGLSPREVRLQALDNKVLSRGIRGKSAPILAEITIRKSQFVFPIPSQNIERILIDHMIEMAQSGAKVLHPNCLTPV
jgi:hypothetical protein